MPFNVTSAGLFQVDENGVFYFDDECCCDVGPENTCNSCFPALLDTYTVTIAGASTFPIDPNGTWTVNWTQGCIWASDLVGGVGVVLFWSGTTWYVQDQEFVFTWTGSTDGCDVPGTYSGFDGTCVVS